MTGRLAGVLRRLADWYGTPSGIAYVVALALVVVVAFLSDGRWGVLGLAVVLATFIPMKLMHLERARAEAHQARRHAAYEVRGIADRLATLVDRTEKLDALINGLGSQVDTLAVKGEVHAARADAIAAIDAARYEWSNILRAERRTTRSFVRSSLAQHGEDERPGER